MVEARTVPGPGAGGLVVGAGALLAVVAVALYLTELSRAVGVVVGGVAAVLLPAGLGIRRADRWPPRVLVVLFVVVLIGLVALGVYLLIVGVLLAEDVTPLPGPSPLPGEDRAAPP